MPTVIYAIVTTDGDILDTNADRGELMVSINTFQECGLLPQWTFRVVKYEAAKDDLS